MRSAVFRTAAEFAQRNPTNQSDRNWLLAEEFLGFKAPGDWIYIELTRWGELYASHERAKARIAELRYQIESRVDSYLPRCWLPLVWSPQMSPNAAL